MSGVRLAIKAGPSLPGGPHDRQHFAGTDERFCLQHWRMDGCLLDRSSGNAGIANTMVGRIIGDPVEILIPGNTSTDRKKRLLAHDAQPAHLER